MPRWVASAIRYRRADGSESAAAVARHLVGILFDDRLLDAIADRVASASHLARCIARGSAPHCRSGRHRPGAAFRPRASSRAPRPLVGLGPRRADARNATASSAFCTAKRNAFSASGRVTNRSVRVHRVERRADQARLSSPIQRAIATSARRHPRSVSIQRLCIADLETGGDHDHRWPSFLNRSFDRVVATQVTKHVELAQRQRLRQRARDLAGPLWVGNDQHAAAASQNMRSIAQLEGRATATRSRRTLPPYRRRAHCRERRGC